MTGFYKAVTYIVIGFLLSYIAYRLNSPFISKLSEGLIPLLTTLLAINMASSAIIAGKISDLAADSDFKFSKTESELQDSVILQLVLIGIAFITGMIRSSSSVALICGQDLLGVCCDAVTVIILIYFIDVIKDIGGGLFSIMNFKKPKKNP